MTRRKLRRFYYDVFARYYDKFVALHSSDAQGELRGFLSRQIPDGNNAAILDLCTGTGALLPHLQERVAAGGLVVGVDFSLNMLKVSRAKTRHLNNVSLIQAEVTALPFREGVFDAVTCSYAFYELKGEAQQQALQEVVRVLGRERWFLMMEHVPPRKPLLRVLFYIRLFSMGAKNAISILKHEAALLEGYFEQVEKIITPSGRSKIMRCKAGPEHGARLVNLP